MVSHREGCQCLLNTNSITTTLSNNSLRSQNCCAEHIHQSYDSEGFSRGNQYRPKSILCSRFWRWLLISLIIYLRRILLLFPLSLSRLLASNAHHRDKNLASLATFARSSQSHASHDRIVSFYLHFDLLASSTDPQATSIWLLLGNRYRRHRIVLDYQFLQRLLSYPGFQGAPPRIPRRSNSEVTAKHRAALLAILQMFPSAALIITDNCRKLAL